MGISVGDYIDAPIAGQMNKVVAIVCNNLPPNETPEEIFSSVSLGQGANAYPNIWVFTQHLVVEIRHPLDKDRIQYDLVRFNHAVDWVRISAWNFAFEDPTEDSQLELEFTTTDGFSGVLSATGAVCRQLMDIYQSRFMDNFISTRAE